MRLRPWTPWTTALLLLRLCMVALGAQEPAHNETQPELVCVPFGECEPCPEDALDEPFCKPFGNRRLVHCLPVAPPGAPVDGDQGEIPAWESCGRIPAVERYDFYEFVVCNVLLAGLGLGVLLLRSRKVQALQAGRLAARIGLGRQ